MTLGHWISKALSPLKRMRRGTRSRVAAHAVVGLDLRGVGEQGVRRDRGRVDGPRPAHEVGLGRGERLGTRSRNGSSVGPRTRTSPARPKSSRLARARPGRRRRSGARCRRRGRRERRRRSGGPGCPGQGRSRRTPSRRCRRPGPTNARDDDRVDRLHAVGGEALEGRPGVHGRGEPVLLGDDLAGPPDQGLGGGHASDQGVAGVP